MNRSGNIGASKNMDSVFADFTEEDVFQDLMFDEDDQLVEIVEGYTEDGNTVFEEDEEIFKIAHQIEDDNKTPEEVKKDTEDLLGPDNDSDQKIDGIENVKDEKLDDSQTYDELKKNGESEADKELGLEKLDDEYNSTADASVKEEYEYDKEDEAEGSDTKFGNKELDNSAMPANNIKPTDDENYNSTNDTSVKEEYEYDKPDEAEGTDDKFGKEIDNSEPKPEELAPNGDENYNNTNDASIKDEPFDEAFLLEAANNGIYVITEAKFRFLPKFKEYKELKDAYSSVEQAEKILNNEGIETSASAEKILKIVLRILDVFQNIGAVFTTIPAFLIVGLPAHLINRGISYLLNYGQEATVKSYASKIIPKLTNLKKEAKDPKVKEKLQKQIDDINDKLNKMENNKESETKATNESYVIKWVHESEDGEKCDCGKDDCPICGKKSELAPTASPIEDKVNDERHEESSGETVTAADGEGITPGNVDDNSLPIEDSTPEGSPEADNGDITDDSDKRTDKPVENTEEKKEDSCEGKECDEDKKLDEAFEKWLHEEDLELPVLDPNETITPDDIEKAEDDLEKSAPESDASIKEEFENLLKEEEDTTASAANDLAAMSSEDESSDSDEVGDPTIDEAKLEEAFEAWLHEEDEAEVPTKSDVEAAAETEVEDTESELDDDLAAVADDDVEGEPEGLEYDPTDEELIDLAGGEDVELDESAKLKK